MLAVPHYGVAAEQAVILKNATTYLRSQQQEDGSFGRPQPRLKTGLAIVAQLSVNSGPSDADRDLIERAVRYVLETSSSTGDLGDDAFRTESHAVALTALICAHEHLKDDDLRTDAAKRIRRAVRHLQRLQDRSSSSASRGGWRMEGRKGRANDRRASAWALLAYRTARLYGIEIPDPNVKRATQFMLGAFKEQSDKPDQIGGFSVDTLGLTVDLISSMGGWVLSRFDGKEESRKKNLEWLARRPPAWSGPNYFYSAFFRIRTLKFGDGEGKLYAETRQRLTAQIADHQQSDGSVVFPPGNAQNTVLMGPVFSTALAILIANVEESRLPFDEDYRLKPLF